MFAKRFGKINPREYVPMDKKILLSLAAGADAILGTVVHAAYLKYYTDFIGLDPMMYGLMYFIFGIWNAINDPLLGLYSDRKKYVEKKGKVVLLMRRSAPLMVISMVGMAYADPSWSQWMIFFFLLAVMFIYDTANTLFGINYKTYMFFIATSPKERTEYSIISKYVNMIPAFIAGLIPVWFLTGEYSLGTLRIIFTVTGLLGALLFAIPLMIMEDHESFYLQNEEEKPFNLLQNTREILKMKSFLMYVMFSFLIQGVQRSYYTFYVYYMDNVMNVSETLALIPDVFGALVQLAIYPLVAKYVGKFGCRDTMKRFKIFSVIGFLGLVVVRQYWLVVLCYGLIMVGFAAYWAVLDPMFGTIIDENELQTNERKTGFFLGIMAVITIPAQSFIVFLYTIIITYFNYDATTKIQTAESMLGIRIGVGLVPALFLILALIPIMLYPIGRKEELEIKKDIEERHKMIEEGGAHEEN